MAKPCAGIVFAQESDVWLRSERLQDAVQSFDVFFDFHLAVCGGLFGFVGYAPNSALFEGKVEMKGGYIVTDEDMHTSVPGVFAAGDVRVKSLRQVITAAADGAIAAMQCAKYIEEM